MGQKVQGRPWGRTGSPTHPGWPGKCWSLLGCSATVSFRRSRQSWLAETFCSSSSLGGPGSGGARRTGLQRALCATLLGTGTSNQLPTTCSSMEHRPMIHPAAPTNLVPLSGHPWEGSPGASLIPRDRLCSPSCHFCANSSAFIAAGETWLLPSWPFFFFFPGFFFCLNSCVSHSRSQSQGSSLYLMAHHCHTTALLLSLTPTHSPPWTTWCLSSFLQPQPMVPVLVQQLAGIVGQVHQGLLHLLLQLLVNTLGIIQVLLPVPVDRQVGHSHLQHPCKCNRVGAPGPQSSIELDICQRGPALEAPDYNRYECVFI